MSSPLLPCSIGTSWFCISTFGICLLLLTAFPAQAQTQHRAAADSVDESDFEPKIRPEFQISRAAGVIEVDGRLDDPGWRSASRVTGFTEIQPDERAEPRVRTEALVAYDDAHLYLGFIAYDDPKRVRASLRDRDEMFQDDWVGVIIDPYGDAAQAYEIFANPLGVQGDLLMASGNEDPGFDLVYKSEGQITEDGYVVEMAIPFSSLRFPDQSVQEWRITFLRNHPRERRRLYSWAATDRDEPCLLCQLGTVSGIENIEPSTNIDLLPAVVGSQAGALADSEDPSVGFDHGRATVEPSINARYNFTPSLAAEATINPDFSQVESDAAQIDVNTTFALSFPERRPFFQEGSDLFDTWIDVVYTRSINDPLAATKLTGRTGRWSLAYLGALDDHTPLLLPFEERSDIVQAGRSMANIFRARRTFGDNSFVGTTLTDRRLLDGGSGSLGSVDLRHQFLKNYRVEAQLVLSDTREPDSPELSEQVTADEFDRGAHTAALDGEHFGGHGLFLSFDRDAEFWNFDLAYEAYSPTFRTNSGFVTANDFRRMRMSQRLNFYPKESLFDFVSPGVSAMRGYNYDGVHKEDYVEAEVFARLKGQTQVFANINTGRERFLGEMFDRLHGWVINVNSQFSEPVSLGGFMSGGRAIRRSGEPKVGRQLRLGVWGTFKPLQRLVISPEVNYSSMHDPETGEAFFSGYILRARTNLQFTRELSLRLVTQYDDFSERLSVEPLLSYKLNPFSVFYVGSTHDYHAFDAPHGLSPTERQFFFKFQYLFQM